MRIKNFLFHRVSNDKDGHWPPMTPLLFEKVIQNISTNHQVVNLENLLQHPECFRQTKKNLATILFDDGYKDNIEYAAPILKKYHCPASFYVVTDSINRNVPTWTYILDYSIQHTHKKTLELPLNHVPDHLNKLAVQSDGIKRLKPWLKSLSNKQRKEVMEVLLTQLDDVSIPGALMMNWNEVRELHQNGFTIGSHTHTHPMLAKLESEEDIAQELETSFTVIKKELGVLPLSISYPIGSFDDRVKELSRKAGYRYGLAVKQQFFNLAADDLWEIPRVELYQEPWWKVSARMHGIYNHDHIWTDLLRKRTGLRIIYVVHFANGNRRPIWEVIGISV